MSFTPGPWAVLEHDRTDRAYPIHEASDPTIVPIGWVGTKNRPNLENARLMAAAPELLEAAEAALDLLTAPNVKALLGDMCCCDPDVGAVCYGCATQDRIRAAIAKAKGEQP